MSHNHYDILKKIKKNVMTVGQSLGALNSLSYGSYIYASRWQISWKLDKVSRHNHYPKVDMEILVVRLTQVLSNNSYLGFPRIGPPLSLPSLCSHGGWID